MPIRHANIAPRPPAQPLHTPTSVASIGRHTQSSANVTPTAVPPNSGLMLPPGMDMSSTSQLLASMQSPTPRQRTSSKTRGRGKAKTKGTGRKNNKDVAADQSDTLIQELLAGLPSSQMLQTDPLTSEEWFPDPSSSMIAQDSLFQYLDSVSGQTNNAVISATTPVAASSTAAAMDVNLDTLQTVLGSDPAGPDAVGGSQVTPDARFIANVRAKREGQRAGDSPMLSSQRGSKRAYPLQGFAKRHGIGVPVGNQMAILSPALLSSSPPQRQQLRQHPYKYYSPPKPTGKVMAGSGAGRKLQLGERRGAKWVLGQDKQLLQGVRQQRWSGNGPARDPADFGDDDWEAIAQCVSGEGVARTARQCQRRWAVMYGHLGEEILEFVDNPPTPSAANTPRASDTPGDLLMSSPPFLAARGGSRQLSDIAELPLEEATKQLVVHGESSPEMEVALSSPEDALRPQGDGVPGELANIDLTRRWEMPVYCQLVADVVQAMSNPNSQAAKAVRKYSGRGQSASTSATPTSMVLAVSEQQPQPLADLLGIPITTSATMPVVTAKESMAPAAGQSAGPLDMSTIDQDMDVYLQFLQSLTNDQSDLLLTSTAPGSSSAGGISMAGVDSAGADWAGLFDSTAAIPATMALGGTSNLASQPGQGDAQQSKIVEMGNGDEDDANDDDFVLNDEDDEDDEDDDEDDDDMASLFAGTPKVGRAGEAKDGEVMWGKADAAGGGGGQPLLADPFLQQLLDMPTPTPKPQKAAAAKTPSKTGQSESFLASRQLMNPVASLLDLNAAAKRGGSAKTPRKRKKKSASASIVRALAAASAVEMDGGTGEAGVGTEVDGLYQDALQDGESIDVQEESLQADNSEYLFTAEQMAQLRDQQAQNFQLVTQAFLLACAESGPHDARARHWKRQLDCLALRHSLGTREAPDAMLSGGLHRFSALIESAERRRARTGHAGVTESGQPAPNPASFFAIPGITAAVPGLYEAVDEIHRAAQLTREVPGTAVVRSFGARMDFSPTCACTPVAAFRSAMALECVVPRLLDAVGHGKRRAADDPPRNDRPTQQRLAALPLRQPGGLPVLLPSAGAQPVPSAPRRAEPPADMRALREALRTQLRGFARDLHKVPRTRRRVFVQDAGGVPRLEWLAVATEPLGLPPAMHAVLGMLVRGMGFREPLTPRIVAVRKPKNRIHFMQAEDALLLMGLRLFGFDDIASLRVHLLPCKTASQLRNRMNNLRARRAPPNAVKDFCLRRIAPFTLEEEETLRVGVLVYGDEFRAVNQNFLVSRPTIALAQVWSHVRGDFA
ncbi:hypothetical protein DL89DRAFT_293244 [Linderina pennispora]|uniref:Myb-like domain-containing protein n=1 Tax=Linderina pennispora TaxID=61395 RepID=A0A1Y1W7V9_9FUNG|nr:uncharacterized protein DL89DRAFT_293244 [Linderina pennispora]ORX69621.1 hypothetical protein DL89DRAFT_293244 [Linderina pennispora]